MLEQTSVLKNLPANAGDKGDMSLILVWEGPLQKEMKTHSSILAWEIAWTEQPGGLHSMESQRVGYNWATKHSQNIARDFPGGIVVKTLPPNAGGTGSIPGWGTKVSHASGCGQNFFLLILKMQIL